MRNVSKTSGLPRKYIKRGLKAWLRAKRLFLPTSRRVKLLRQLFIQDKKAAFLIVMPEMVPFVSAIRKHLQRRGFEIFLEERKPRLSLTDIIELYGLQIKKYPSFLRAPLIRNWPTVLIAFKTKGADCFNEKFKRALREELVNPLFKDGRIPDKLPGDLKNFLESISAEKRGFLFGIHMPASEHEILKDSNVFLTQANIQRIVDSALYP